MTTVTVYRSTDTSAPALSGSAGALITVLDAVLVNGYGTQPAAGWTKPFSATSKGTYRMSTVDGTGFYLSVDDTGGGAGSTREAFMTGFEVVTAQGVGTGQFPTGSQLALGSAPSGAVVCRKSTTADGTARAWTIVADDTCFYLFAETTDLINPTQAFPFMFGDIFSYKSSDAYRCMIIGRNLTNSGNSNSDPFSALSQGGSTALINTLTGHFIARSWTATGGSVLTGKHADVSKMGQYGVQPTATGTTGLTNGNGVCLGFNKQAPGCFPYPNGPDGGLYLSPIWIHHSGSVRGYLKGAWCPLHNLPLNHNDTYSGTGTLSGKSFVSQMIPCMQSGTNADWGQVHIETSSTWS